ncbi:MAG: MBL fold metallo-hydrolase, partial [bacterium]
CWVCSSGAPRDTRLRSSILVQSPTTTLVVDTGPDFRYQMLRKKVRHLDAVVFTHPHKDHLAGLDDIRAFNHFGQKPMQVFADSLTEEALRRDCYYAFAESRYPGIPELQLQTITE